MEFNLLVNFMPIFSIILFIIVTIITIFQKLKLRWPVKLNCWFCNNNSKVWRQQANWWLCPRCEQYNGFSKNGDYAYSIPEQYKISSHNNRRYCSVAQDTKVNKISTSRLCNQCTKTETLKLSKLSNYVPMNEKNYEQEVKKFKKSLEQEYPLCTQCKSTVHNVLYKQALWLAEYKMLLFKQKPFQVIANNKKYSEPIFRIFSTIFDSMVVYNMDLLFLPIGGLLFQFCACCVASTRRKSSDVLLMFLWICIIILLPFKDSKIMKIDFHNKWVSLEYITQYHMIMFFTSIIAFINVKPKSYKSTMSKNLSFKKIGFSSKNTSLPDLCTSTLSDKYSFDTKIISDVGETISNEFSPSITNESIPFSIGQSVNKRTLLKSPFINQESQLLSTPINDNCLLFNSSSLLTQKANMNENYALNDSLSTLSTLSLSEDKPKYIIKNKAPKIFERKVYNPGSSKLFKRLNGTFSKKNSISPPKLKSVTQLPWVADGYWQNNMDLPSLSRSSSPSSGFGSVGSNFAPSREPSIHEFDQCSTVSDFTQSCYTSRQTNISPRNFYHPSLQFPLSDLKGSFNNQTTKFTSFNTYTQPKLLLPHSDQKNGSVFMDQCSQAQNINESNIKSPFEKHTFPSHTTIVSVPVWLSALLCGSLVLNIIVLSTTLVR
ncbi:uncharacterized protein LOC117225250 [Megalopta genalis]|uniref:uncharacterized protein LOC117225250 n=1 Tax=Megalopta genalis TaxID=115081 RepID=UPI003FD309EB